MRLADHELQSHCRAAGCDVDLVPDGPALVRGAARIRDADGRVHEVTRPVVAVCMCGLSQRAPWCDATHKVAKRRPRSVEAAG